MSTANFAGRGGTITRIAPHATGHTWARGGTLLRVDCCQHRLGWWFPRSFRPIRRLELTNYDLVA